MKVLRHCLWLATALLLVGETARSSPDAGPVVRGEYLFRAAGCAACHTDELHTGAVLAGGRELPTPFGLFVGPNITPDPRHGIGGWTEDDFVRALRRGVSPQGRPYFPAFPYAAFTQIGDEDLRALWLYLRTIPPASRANRPHELGAPFGWRSLVRFWNFLYFAQGPFRASISSPPLVERGRYLSAAAESDGNSV